MSNFRNYQQLQLESSNAPVLIIGENGAGKTNILEAISLLAPGRGLRGAHIKEIVCNGTDAWAINANIQRDDITYNVGVGFCDNKKVIKIDHKIQSKQISLAAVANLIWLTPQMDTIFLGSRKSRLDFFDRIVFSFDSQHAPNMSKYEFARRERARLLREKMFDQYWLSSLEEKMVQTGISIAKSRQKIIEILQGRIEQGPFQNIKVFIRGEVEDHLGDLEEIFSTTLQQNRQIDSLSKRTNYGIHTSDFNAVNLHKLVEAKLCSTGEQKLMLIAIILAASKKDTILLLDDIVSHLDHANRNILLTTILERDCQAWITDTNLQNFSEYSDQMQIFHIKSGSLVSGS